MTTALQLRRGTSAQHATFTGANGEVTVDTTEKSLRVHDGVTAGGSLLAKLSDIIAGVRYDISQALNAAQQLMARTNIGALVDPSANGLVAKTGAGTASGRTLTAGTGISVSNGDGVSGNPTVTNDGVTSFGGSTGVITLGSGLSMSGNTLSSTITGGVTTFNTRSGAVTLTSSDVTGALGFTPPDKDMGTSSVGSIAFVYKNTASAWSVGATIAGSSLCLVSMNGTSGATPGNLNSNTSIPLAGTWRNLGGALGASTGGVTLAQRIS